MSIQLNSAADVLAECVTRLSSWAAPGGGWPYQPGSEPQIEPTFWAALALNSMPEAAEQRTRAIDWLETQQAKDGHFGIRGGFPKAVWPTAFAALLLAKLRPKSQSLPSAIAWLLHHEGQRVEPTPELVRDFDIDPSISGWSWTERSFAWVEPTAWVVQALRAAGFSDHPRVKEGQRLLLDRAYDEGGVNYGNRLVFGKPTEPVPADTAAFLLAFVESSDQPKLAASRQFLLRHSQEHSDLENLCWCKLALQPWSASDPAVRQALPELTARIGQAYATRQEQDFFRPSVVRTALTALALRDQASLYSPPGNGPLARIPGQPRPQQPSWTERWNSRLRGLMIGALARMKEVTVPAIVQVTRAEHYDQPLAEFLGEQYDSFRAKVPLRGKKVVLKPNLVEYHPDKVINTDPRVVAAVIELCQREGAAEIVVAEGPGHWRNVEFIVNESGLGAVLQRAGIRFIDLNHDDPVETPNLGRCTPMEFLYLSKTIAEADVLISMPKMKTHHWAGVTLSLKNLFGTLPGQCYGWPKNELHWHGIEKSIVDIALTRGPDLCIVDGIIGMEGDGPLNGEAKNMGVLVMGADPLAVDATCCRLMGLKAELVPHLALARERRVGVLDEGKISVHGVPISAARRSFEPHPKFAALKADF